MLASSLAQAEPIHWATTPDFPQVLQWELCDEGGVCEVLVVADAKGGTLPDGRAANLYWADTLVLPGKLAWIRAQTVEGVAESKNKDARVWCSQWDFNNDNRIFVGDLASWLRLGGPGGAPEFARGLGYFLERCR